MILRLKSENFLRTRVLAVFGPMAPLAKGDDDADYEDEAVIPRRKRARPTPKECCIRGCAGDGRIRLPLELDAHVKLKAPGADAELCRLPAGPKTASAKFHKNRTGAASILFKNVT